MTVEIKEKQEELVSIERQKEQADEVLKDMKKESGKLSREVAEIEQKIRVIESEMSKKHPVFIKAKEKVTHSQKKLTTAQKNLEQAKKAHEAHAADIQKLEEEILAIRKNQKEFEQKIKNESQKQGKSFVSDQTHVEEYDRLKQKAEATAAKYVSELESINREQKSDQDLLDNEINKKEQIEAQLEKFRLEKEEVRKRMEKLYDHIRTSEQALQDQIKLKDELKNDVGSSKERIAELQKELEDVRDQLGDAKGDKHEDARRKKKQEVVELFKREVPGVVSSRGKNCREKASNSLPFPVRPNDQHVPADAQALQRCRYEGARQVHGSHHCRHRENGTALHSDPERADARSGNVFTVGLSASEAAEAALARHSRAEASQTCL